MTYTDLTSALQNGAYDRIFQTLYGKENISHATKRYLSVVNDFAQHFGTEGDLTLFSVPGRTEISGNHTDHNLGKVLAGAVDLDIVAVAKKTADTVVTMESLGFSSDCVDIANPVVDEKKFYTSESIISGTADAFLRRGLKIGGFTALAVSNVFKGSGLSSSAAFEVMIGNILNHFYNDDRVDAPELAKIGQEAENRFFGKPCGLMDQTACAVGSFVAIDFADPQDPVIEKLPFDLNQAGYSLCIVNTGGNHADLNDDYASVPAEMKAVANELGQPVLRPLTYQAVLEAMPTLRARLGDRAVLRALHFLFENDRVTAQTEALRRMDVDTFLSLVTESGNSSYKRLQNVFTVKNVKEQGLSLALAVAEIFFATHPCEKKGACRVHGGGFAGTIQAFVPTELTEAFCAEMDGVFGAGACHVLRIRPYGAICVDDLK